MRQYKTSKAKRDYAKRRRATRTPAERRAQAAYQKQYAKANKARLAATSREYQRKHALRIQLRRKGIPRSTYDAFIAEFGDDRCMICDRPPGGRWNAYVVDHDHNRKTMRGILCNRCNVALGLLDDRIDILQSAIKYLRAYFKRLD